jgi:hypothetical protein
MAMATRLFRYGDQRRGQRSLHLGEDAGDRLVLVLAFLDQCSAPRLYRAHARLSCSTLVDGVIQVDSEPEHRAQVERPLKAARLTTAICAWIGVTWPSLSSWTSC